MGTGHQRTQASSKRRRHVTPLDWLLPCGGETVLPDCKNFQEMPEYELCEIARFLNVGSFKKKKKKGNAQNTPIKQNTSAGWFWQLGHQFATCDRDAEICRMSLGDRG